MCAQNAFDLMILEAKAGVCAQKPVDFVELDLSSYFLIYMCVHFLVDLMIKETKVGVFAQKHVDFVELDLSS